jgi:dipeptidyl aminopeptidase/acylaminoacyl peptidase
MADQLAQQGICTAEDLARLPEIVAADLAPDGGSTVYAATTRDGRTALERTLLWRSTSDGVPELLGDTEAAQGAPAFSPDGTRIAYLRDVAGKPQVAVLTLADRTTEVLTGFPRGVGAGGPRWSPDGTTLAFTACDEPVREPGKPYRVTRPVWRRDALGLVDDVKGDLWTVPSAGGTPTRLTFHDGIVGQVQWSPDGTALLYDCFAEPSTAAVTLRTVSADGTRTHVVLDADYLVYPPTAAWLSDGRIVRTTGWDVYKRLDLAVHDPATGTDTNLNVTLPGQIGGLMQMNMNGALFATKLVVDHPTDDVYLYVQTGGRLELARISTSDGSSEIVHTGDFAVTPIVLRGTNLLLARTSFAEPATLTVFDVADRTEHPVAGLDRGWLAEPPFTVRELRFDGADGTPVEGWFLEPRNGSGPYPTVLNIHGGPFAVYGHSFSIDNHLFTSAGYGVLLVNYRGSSGYGEDFARSLIADWGNNDAGDLLAGVDHAVSLGLVDPARIGSFGLSGGGYLTSWLLTHDNRFSAGIAECPVTDWNGMVGSDIPQLVARWMAEEPGHGPDSMVPYVRMSPATYAADCETPMLIVEHEGDLRCPSGQGDVFYNALHLAGRTVEMLRLPGMFHGGPYEVADLPGRIERLAALTEWFDRYLKS